MGFSFLRNNKTSNNIKKEEPLSSLVLKTYISQTVQFILNEEQIDYKSTLMTIFESINCII